MHDLKDLDITEFTRSKEEGYFISSNAPSSGLFIKLERYKELEQRVKELEEEVKKAFWWSAEFTANVHGNNIQKAWEDYYKSLRP